MAETLFVSEISLPKPLPGQSARSSDNFDLNKAPSGATNYHFVVESSLDPNNIPNIVFKVSKDVSGGSDYAIYDNVRNGSTLPVNRNSAVYIIYKSGTTKPFKVKIYAIV